MEGILIVLIALAIICFAGKSSHSGGGCNIKDAPKTKKPDIQPAPQPKIK
jgi:hypothetical protein